MKTMLIPMMLATVIGVGISPAETVRESYVAVLSERDHFSSKGDRLTSAAAIIRQDRANYHKFGKRDPGDGDDRFFASANNREALERLLNRGTSNPSALRAIVNGTPTVTVNIYRSAGGLDYVNVFVNE